MKTSMLVIAGAALMMSLGGCVSMGPNYDPAAVDTLQLGMDKAEVVKILGRPTTRSRLPDGREQLMWVHSRGTMLGTASGRAVMLMFDASGKYAGLVSSSETNLR